MGTTPSLGSGHGFALAFGGVIVAVWLALMAVSLNEAALPPETDGTVLAVFPPGTTDEAAFTAMVRAGGEPVRPTWLGFAWVARGADAGFVGRLKSQGAVAAFGELPVGPALGGCAVMVEEDKRPKLYELR
ncbi:MAG TPA: hypothetical protein VGE72_00060 [Azospirillum sp.]